MVMLIQTPRLILRTPTPYDAFDMFEYAKDPRVGPMAGWLPHQNIQESNEILKKLIDSNEVWAIVDKTTGKMIGTIGLHLIRSSNIPARSLGYVLNPSYWGQGIVKEAGEAIIDYGFKVLELEVIRVSHYKENNQSRRVIEKLGFTYEGLSRKYYIYPNGVITDSLNYSITKEEFFKKDRF